MQMSDLPDDEDEVSWGFRCCGVVVVLWLTVGVMWGTTMLNPLQYRAGRSVIPHAACQEGVDEIADKKVSFAVCS